MDVAMVFIEILKEILKEQTENQLKSLKNEFSVHGKSLVNS